ncbi:FtsH protease activity modulator HflK [Thiopseudomonas acetoxidans]|uniref:Protein HflK n=1 Tax=Thiopseudomonas acetoxidans TaxID=3041622 RepID=A0ABT7SPZ3_9GAMM|nr:FtsH protease activity modulator HflK [Thiopseudomonas sp. CY1220]MDM7858250.1 FtsH protease activity modulator HflK [Thiopseudomonas sp. CY1220]NLC10329.1 FtsH protease activity modulator HflK [Gammaproteobacteria bacterium]
MAWNEPGGNSNNQDPWGGGNKKGGGRQGPPDLDEALRKLQDKLNSIFGGKKKPGGQGSGGGVAIVLIALVVLVGFWLSTAVYKVDEQERAVILRLGKYHETVGPGLNIYFPPIEQKFQHNVTRERAYTRQGPMLTEDENIIEVPLTVQYKISNLEDFVLNVDGPEISLQQATESALRHVVGSTSMDQVLTEGREVLAVDVRERLQRFIDMYRTGIVVTGVNVQNAQAPKEVQEAFDDVIRAREDEQREKNDAETYANGVVPEARGLAQRILEEANGYREEVIARAEGESERFTKLVTEYHKAPEVTRKRLYLDTMEEMYSRSSKVLLTGDKGQNSLLYLPLDKMLQQGQSAPAARISNEPVDSSTLNTPASNDAISRSLRSRGSR